MTLSKANVAGWSTQDQLTPTQMNHIDAELIKAVDGVAGGDYAPSAVVGIGGSGIRMDDDNRLLYNSRSITRVLPVQWVTTSGNWLPSVTTRPVGMVNGASGGTLFAMLNGLPDGQTVTSIDLLWDGASGHGALPVMPGFAFESNSTTLDTDVSYGTPAVDTSASVGVYEAYHYITWTGSHVIDTSDKRYYLRITGETGGNFVANARAILVRATFTVTSQPEV